MLKRVIWMILYYIINTVEIALLIILPLIIYYQRNNIKSKDYILNIIILYLAWFFTYALVHEFFHLLGAWITNGDVIDYQLIPRFWQGDFKTGYVKTNYNSLMQEFFIVILPYIKDVLFTIIGCIIMWKIKMKNSFVIGLVLIIFIFNSVFDVFNNYLSYLYGAHNDFNAMKITTNEFIANLVGILFSFITLGGSLYILLCHRILKSN